MDSMEIRHRFFNFFVERNHTKVSSSSLVPAHDPTLLFTNAGMNQFKDVFLNMEQRSYSRAVSIQKCMRAGGKHSYLDNVGFTNRHLTFFEMMGNFSFGDYFKKEAITFAWEFLTNNMGFDNKTMYITVFRDDDESYELWHGTIGVPQERIYRLGQEDNFWQMGDTGPCGPCSEIYVDRGIIFGCGSSDCAPGCSCDRFMEVWNLVFMQYDRQPDGSKLPLKKKGVDTGMGFERLCLIMQKKDSIFETDLFMPIIKRAEELTGLSYNESSEDIQSAFNVLADHTRAATFLIADGVTPTNEGRGYVLRKIIRRASLFAQKITDENILPALAAVVVEHMDTIYPELKPALKAIAYLLKLEVEKFADNLLQGQNILSKFFAQSATSKMITGQQAFKLYDTYGFPLELTKVIAQEKGFTVDTQGFENQMEKQRQRSGKKVTKIKETLALPKTIKTEFTGYKEFETNTIINGLIQDDQLVDNVSPDQECWVITKQSPFYVAKGGQVSDKGWIAVNDIKIPFLDLMRIDNAIAVKIVTPMALKIDQKVRCLVDRQYRLDIMNNHTATHLLQAALIELLGKEVKQSGSLVHPDYLRFDFTYHGTLTPEQIKTVEDVVNQKIRENIPLNIYETTYQDAMEKGVIAIFGEKYDPEKVRVIDIPGFSMELCGGTHVRATGDIGCFKITEESALSAGQRRIFAVTGTKATELLQQTFNTVKALSQEFKVQSPEVVQAVMRQQEQLKEAQSLIKKLKKENVKAHIPQWIEAIEYINEIPFGFVALEEYSGQELKEIAFDLIKRKSGFYFLLSTQDDSVNFYAQMTDHFVQVINMSALAQWLRESFNLKGGGRAQTLQGGGPFIEPKILKQALTQWLSTHTSSHK